MVVVGTKSAVFVSALLVVLSSTTTGYVAYRYALERHGTATATTNDDVTPTSGPASSAAPMPVGIDPSNGKRIAYWHDPMVPSQRFDKPGKSPFMDMMLVPVYTGDAVAPRVVIDPHHQQNLGVRVARVVEGRLALTVKTFGNVTYNERDQAVVSNRVPITIERLLVRARLDRVTKGQALAEYVAPEWDYLQADLLSARRFSGPGAAALVDGARRRLTLAGMSKEQVRHIEAADTIQERFTLTAPSDGAIVELNVREGSTVMPGTTLFRINGTARVWVEAIIPQSKATGIRAGMPVSATAPNAPGQVFKGAVQSLLGEADPTTRTLRARIELRNEHERLRPGMYVDIRMHPTVSGTALLVPTEAVIPRGERHFVVLSTDGGFEPVEVKLGARSDDQVEIRDGLHLGQDIVVSGQFLIDSEANLNTALDRMQGHPAPATIENTRGEYELRTVSPD